MDDCGRFDVLDLYRQLKERSNILMCIKEIEEALMNFACVEFCAVYGFEPYFLNFNEVQCFLHHMGYGRMDAR